MRKDKKANSRTESGLGQKNLVLEALASIGFKGKISSGDYQWDFIAQMRGGPSEYIQYKKMIPVRHQQLLESIAYIQFTGSKQKIDPKHLWLVVVLENIQDSTIEKILDFCKKFEVEINILLVDTNGQIVLMRDGTVSMEKTVHNRVELLDDLKTIQHSKSLRRISLAFTPNQQWILKHLLLNGIEKKYWGYEENKRLMLSTELAHATGIVQSACYETLKQLEAQGYLIPSKTDYKFRDLHNLIENWRRHLQSQRKMEFYSTPYQPGISEEQWWSRSKKDIETHSNSLTSRYAVGGMAASAWYGLKVSSDFSIIFHLGTTQATSLEKLRDLFHLASSDEPTNIKIVLHKSFKPVVEVYEVRPDSDPYVDILQAAFDSRSFGGRGVEQFEKILNKVLLPFWKQKGWTY